MYLAEFILKFKFGQLKIKAKIWGISRTVHIGQICAMQVVRHGNTWAASRLSAQRQRGSHPQNSRNRPHTEVRLQRETG